MKDFELKYKSALGTATTMYVCAKESNDKEMVQSLEFIFPELKKSEDEKIRESIIDLVEKQMPKSENKKRMIAWLEKQGKTALDVIKEEKVDNANKVEPKFKVGDLIKHNKVNVIYKILSVNNGSYHAKNIGTDDNIELFNAEQSFHLWSIKDAIDGDILCFDDDVFILKYYILFNKVVCHCCYNKYFMLNHAYSIIKEDFSKIHPATKEQRDFLFQKMEVLGYEWDAEKKELKKIEQKPTQWSEKDETTLACLIGTLTWATNNNYHCSEDIPKYMCWLENLKQRLNGTE